MSVGSGLSASLWASSSPAAAKALRHPFVRGLADGTLPLARFQGYVAQDATFLDAFIRAYALALASAPAGPAVEAFADLVAGVREELRLHRQLAARWGVDLAAVVPRQATLDYTGFLVEAAREGDVGVTCAAMTPCMRLYAHLGSSLAAGPVADAYREWVDAYADPGFEQLAQTLERLLDEHADAADVRVSAAYHRAVQLELAFFDDALRG